METSTQHHHRTAHPTPTEPHWQPLYRIATATALISAILIPIQITVFLIWPPPLDGTAVDWFTLLQDHRIAGLIDLDLLLVADNILLIPILLALYLALRSTHQSIMMLAVALGLVSVVLYLASNPAIQMATLSDQYATATTDIERTTASAAGAAALTVWQGTAFHAAYLLGSSAGILLGVAMLHNGVFSRPTGWLAIGANTTGLGLYVPQVGVFIAVFSVVILEIWYLLIARRLQRLGHARPA